MATTPPRSGGRWPRAWAGSMPPPARAGGRGTGLCVVFGVHCAAHCAMQAQAHISVLYVQQKK